MSQSNGTSAHSRREFLARVGVGAAAIAVGTGSSLHAAESSVRSPKAPKKIPIGIELYAVRGELSKDLPGTLRAVAQMGYEVVEFYSPYLGWTFPYAKSVRTQLDDLGLKCYSTHNNFAALTPGDTMTKAIELNQILGARHIILASPPGNAKTLDDWKRVAGQLTSAVEVLKPHGLLAGFHNHYVEWLPLEGGGRIMDVLADNTPPEFVLQLDVGTVLEAGVDPIAWINAHPGRIRSSHLKDWAPGKDADEKGFRVLFGEGTGQWAKIFDALETVGGVEFYLMEQEGSRFSELETAKRGLETWRKLQKSR